MISSKYKFKQDKRQVIALIYVIIKHATTLRFVMLLQSIGTFKCMLVLECKIQPRIKNGSLWNMALTYLRNSGR